MDYDSRPLSLFVCLSTVLACSAHKRDASEEPPLPACPSDGLINNLVPLFPDTVIRTRTATTKGRMDWTGYHGDVAAPFRRVRAFYIQCLGSEPLDRGHMASFACPVTGTRWEPARYEYVIEHPRDMADTVSLTDHGDGTTEVSIDIAIPFSNIPNPWRESPSTPTPSGEHTTTSNSGSSQ